MFIGIKMRDDIPTKEDFIRNSIDLDRSKGWELISASTIMKNEFKYRHQYNVATSFRQRLVENFDRSVMQTYKREVKKQC